jgi:hypothetical protein
MDTCDELAPSMRLECDVHVTQVVQEACGRELSSRPPSRAVKSRGLGTSKHGALAWVLEYESSTQRSALLLCIVGCT